jgi:hypothetical protein
LWFHGVAALAARHLRANFRPIPRELATAEFTNSALQLEAYRLIKLIRETIDGPFILLKGVDTAAYYPAASLRPIRDVDILVPDVVAAQHALLRAGWRTKPTPGFHEDPASDHNLHQLCPVLHPMMSLPVEMHRNPNWPTWAKAPTYGEIAADALPSVVGIDNVLAPSVEQHALVLLAHSWARQPFEQMSQLIDFALLLEHCDRSRLHETARRWGLETLVEIGEQTVASVLFAEGHDPTVVRQFASHLRTLTTPSRFRAQYNRYAASVLVAGIPSALRASVAGAARRAVNRAGRLKAAPSVSAVGETTV